MPDVRNEFCHHPKGDAARTVPPCLRTLDDEGRCPVHVDDVFAAGDRVRHAIHGVGVVDTDERLDGQVGVKFDVGVGSLPGDVAWCNPHNLDFEEFSRA